ncbi:large-conductance mechanosensitive channel protein MscL [Lacticaseibacillus paracasei]|uniref:large-conductance mechanosensitive channel protein MscL n=1 Tax=Lacticaseibacillus paracasei TaxID=1597 RepID=UPI0018916F81|nr:large-conductance mechanosensitive channel protein MscL [Lacticaseibacillus paracasei]MCI0373946.1 large-conductance mechanosensitive channel protein MscL [Lacticaseibacillus paracasei]QOP48396.1 large-conductance mechanosensitive channel protein MscL [Lacticaseibacillus paracasei]QPB58042.1 large-conductance mechanosensitive channel protein MscL [Lacticaseibacillus paracasei]WPQ30352.1 large-conductance mechanosensitive channel protein MscL [Lacticaseibacillus paracasei]CAD7484854.1 Large-
MLKEFQKFIMRGNVLDLAVGVIIGSAFTGLVTSLTKNLINPILSMFAGKTDLSGLYFTILGAKFTYGNFINDVLNFLIIAFVVFLLVKGINRILPSKPAKPAGPTQEELLTEIRDLLKQDQQV